MEALSSKTQHQSDAIPYFKGLLDRIRADESQVERIYEELGYLDGKTDAVRERLERTFYSAIMAQREAIVTGSDDAKRLANEVSQLTYHMGSHNNYLPVHDYPAELRDRNYVAAEELKVLQVQRMYAHLCSITEDPDRDYETKAEAELRIAAVERYVETTGLDGALDGLDDDTTGNKKKDGGIFQYKDKAVSFLGKAAAAITLSAITLGVTANAGHAAQKSNIDDESHDPNDDMSNKPRTFKAPIKLATPAVIEPPTRIEASPSPNIIPIPTVPNTPPAAPAPAIEAAPAAPIPEVIIDPNLAGETLWTAGQLEKVRDNFPVYHEVQIETGVPWEVMAALHTREYGLKLENPANGQGIYQLYSTGEYFAPGPVSVEEFKHQTILAANFLKGKAQDNRRVGGPMDFSNPDKIKDALFAYNGLAAQYFQQAANLGFALGAEGSPYVMNLADDRRNSNLNPGWGQILTDNGPLGRANHAPGAWPLIEGLQKINKIARDQMAAKQAAEAAAAAQAAQAAAAAAAEADKRAKTASSHNEIEPFTGWGRAINDNAPMTSPFGPRGNGGLHTGEDYGLTAGAPFLAAIGGEVKVVVVDIRHDPVCLAALANIGFPVSQVKDPIQKEVHIRRMIDGDEYVVVYAHLSEVSVAPGQIVKKGEVVGKTGGSGCSTGDHAHIEIRKNGIPVDPSLYLPR
jgi:murein DD-endopeptidase MepM/ murein hydrolase activator NlpD